MKRRKKEEARKKEKKRGGGERRTRILKEKMKNLIFQGFQRNSMKNLGF